MSLTDFPALVDTFPVIDADAGDQLNTAGKEHDDLENKHSNAIAALERVIVGPTHYNVEGRAEATFLDRWTAALAEAQAGNGGKLIVTGGPKSIAGGLGIITKKNIDIEVPGGAGRCPITYTGPAGDILRYATSPSTTDMQGAIKGLHLISAVAGVKAVRCVDVATVPAMEDVTLSVGGAGSVCLDLENSALWSERASSRRVRLVCNDTARGLRMTGAGGANSFGYAAHINLELNIGLNAVGIETVGTALVYNGDWHIVFNIDANGGKVFLIGAGTSISGWGVIRGEQTTGTGGIFRDTTGGGVWAMSGYFNVLGLPDSGSIHSPFELVPDGRILRRWPVVPTAAAEAGMGSGAPAPTVSGTDSAHTILAGTGTGAISGPFVDVTFSTPMPYIPVIAPVPFGDLTGNLGTCYLAGVSTTGYSLGFTSPPASSQPLGTYGVQVTVSL